MSRTIPSSTKLGRISVVYDSRLSRQRSSALSRILNTIRQFAEVKLLNGSLSEEQLIQELEANPVQLVLVPWYRYLSWSKAEAFYGLTRTTGPTIAGYHFGQLMPHELRAPEHLRTILMDFAGPSPADIARIVRTLLVDTQRSGIRPLLDAYPNTPVYFEDWVDPYGLGHRIDSVLSIPEIGKTDWLERASAIRIVMSALWSLIYDEGPGKSEFAQVFNATKPKAYFQVGANSTFLALRLIYSMPTWCSKDVLELFWPNPEAPTSAPQLLLRYTDYLRVHRIEDTTEIEVVAGFVKGAPAQRFIGQIHTFWIEPLVSRLVEEIAFERPGPETKYLRSLVATVPQRIPAAVPGIRDKAIEDLGHQVAELKQALRKKEERISEMKSGGIGIAPTLPSPDTESLLESFLDRFYSTRTQIQNFEAQIEQLRSAGIDATGITHQMNKLVRYEQGWIRKLAEALRLYAEEKKRLKKAA